ncbi:MULTISPECIES: GNAT family N-acetyltransferase [Vibrio]|uniref:GNAT family N-acetyltransferase n=1 Tax=Vibrio TaxID=662 RepID=UPI002074D0F7|nr:MULTISPECIES: GNAT family N-acetyltransferase [Vibrio]USD35264.1 GNAT family N-acetyltransferase [Vibrio sp. SCSIO 43186]USD48331.1 GNAT family N-acetyltransferase [Vibrio sp. SCSIO 43145]USD72389.1 GNAT family N-acetyltransferase [Vibrio sp. SCSIO 43139]USD98067.1 GNAT family N-acetyltransferase [Vibrio coralliilyticus]
MQLELLKEGHREKLLEFELQNREWFEANIPPREMDFYSQKGVQEHIQMFLLEFTAKTLIPMLIVEDGEILGRVNVSNINRRKKVAHLGYRVGKSFTNRGVAKFAVSNIIQVVEEIGVKTLIAYASTENVASQKVLIANGFKQNKVVNHYAEMNGEPIDCIEFQLRIT